jgi:hypothetical protein
MLAKKDPELAKAYEMNGAAPESEKAEA